MTLNPNVPLGVSSIVKNLYECRPCAGIAAQKMKNGVATSQFRQVIFGHRGAGLRSMANAGVRMMRWIILCTALAITTTAAAAQSVEEIGRKRLLCVKNTKQLIGLTRDQLRERCGIWSHINSDVSASGQREQVIYEGKTGPRFYVYLSNGRVRTVHKR